MTPPVTEIALLRLKSNPASASFKALLLDGIKAQAEFSSYPVYLFSQVEDPSVIYLVGGWDSAQQHYEDWIPSATNQGIMERLSGEMEVMGLLHVDGDAVRQRELLAEAPVVAVGRYVVSAEKREGFDRVFEGMQHRLENATMPLPIFKGWRVEKEEGKEEFVLFSGWTEMQQHLDFAQSEGFQEYSKIKEYTDSSEVKHIVRWKVE